MRVMADKKIYEEARQLAEVVQLEVERPRGKYVGMRSVHVRRSLVRPARLDVPATIPVRSGPQRAPLATSMGGTLPKAQAMHGGFCPRLPSRLPPSRGSLRQAIQSTENDSSVWPGSRLRR